MADLTRERREEMRRDADDLPDDLFVDGLVPVTLGEILALLDAADERDRLREAYVPKSPQWPPAGHGECQCSTKDYECWWPHCPAKDGKCPLPWRGDNREDD